MSFGADSNEQIEFEESSGSVFADLGLEDAEELFMRAKIGFFVCKILEEVICRIKGVSQVAESSDMSRKGVQKALSEDGHPKFESVNAILHAMGYWLAPRKLQSSTGQSS